MNILITGATGFIGNHLLHSLGNQGHKVIAGVHNINKFKTNNPFIKAIACNYSEDNYPELWFERLQNIDIVINTVGIIKESPTQQFKTIHKETPTALFKACEIMGITKVINISALGADANAVSQFHCSKKIADDYLRTLNLNWIIVRPSIVYGTGAKSMTLFKIIAALPITPLLDKGEQKIQPIHVTDLCTAISKIVTSTKLSRTTIDFVGPKAITMKELLTQLKLWLGMSSILFIYFPTYFVIFISKIIKLIPQNIVTPETIQMLNQGNSADIKIFHDHFKFMPKSFTESLQQYPAQQQDRWHVKLILLQTLLKLSIAMVWIMTGIVSMFFYPLESSYQLLNQIGIIQKYAPTVLYSAAVLDILLGLAILFSFRVKMIAITQIVIILSYTALITVFLPEQWLHPFGPISKNIPLIITTAIMIVLHDKNWK